MSKPGMAGHIDGGAAELSAVKGGRLGRLGEGIQRLRLVEEPDYLDVDTGRTAELVDGPPASAAPAVEGQLDPRHKQIQAALHEVDAAHAEAGAGPEAGNPDDPAAHDIRKYLEEAA